MSDYHTFSPQDALSYAKRHGGLENPETLHSAEEIGDGNLNLVFRILDAQGVSRMIVKQAVPYVRCVGESWPLTLDRARIEAETLRMHGGFCPLHTVNVLHHDAGLAVMLQEDLSDHVIWRRELLAGRHHPRTVRQLGEYLARTLFHTSDFYQPPEEKKTSIARFTNPQMCRITEDLFFTDPYIGHVRNVYEPALAETVARLKGDHELKLAVAALKHVFLTKTEALLHGDLHSGSIFVAGNSLKVIDAEFGFYGPMGFDIGTAMGNLLLNYCGLPGLLPLREAAACREQRLQDTRELWQSFAEGFQSLAAETTRDLTLAEPEYVQYFLRRVWADALGYAGTELIRRTIGLAHVADLDDVADAAMRHECKRLAVKLGRMLILGAPHIGDIPALIARVRQTG
ncbi:S-methyl-5-thioribose kinase [Martelella alba]|uniref:S-methyl-5-thioribose kinase n=1 Tax=Martelella alba TaxID=2590451 RepID=A0ABY2SIY0_9HYPH|nr:S-methyl-5-thioribose kinase [Martelella alba]TKI04875.1 S-methyl-5-thioribose kinase [Martelella alba]